MYIDKQVAVGKIKELSKQYRAQGKQVVFTNGCFDIIHAGHVSYLSRARALGDVLVLGLNSDASVKKIKGEKRPIICQEHRIIVLSALTCIDHIVLFDEPDPEQLIETVCPDILVKGADWPEDKIVGGPFVKKNGGRIERISFEQDISTTHIIDRIGVLYYGN